MPSIEIGQITITAQESLPEEVSGGTTFQPNLHVDLSESEIAKLLGGPMLTLGDVPTGLEDQGYKVLIVKRTDVNEWAQIVHHFAPADGVRAKDLRRVVYSLKPLPESSTTVEVPAEPSKVAVRSRQGALVEVEYGGYDNVPFNRSTTVYWEEDGYWASLCGVEFPPAQVVELADKLS